MKTRDFRQPLRMRGSTLIESVCGLIILIPICLVLFDAAALIIAQSTNDTMCKHAARAAASQTNLLSATAAANNVINNSPNLGLVTTGGAANAVIAPFHYNDANYPGGVYLKTKVTLHYPVPIPFVGLNTQVFVTDDYEPITAMTATTSTGTVGNAIYGQQPNPYPPGFPAPGQPDPTYVAPASTPEVTGMWGGGQNWYTQPPYQYGQSPPPPSTTSTSSTATTAPTTTCGCGCGCGCGGCCGMCVMVMRK